LRKVEAEKEPVEDSNKPRIGWCSIPEVKAGHCGVATLVESVTNAFNWT